MPGYSVVPTDERRRVATMLQSLEWSKDYQEKKMCPWCAAFKTDGHNEVCELLHAINVLGRWEKEAE